MQVHFLLIHSFCIVWPWVSPNNELCVAQSPCFRFIKIDTVCSEQAHNPTDQSDNWGVHLHMQIGFSFERYSAAQSTVRPLTRERSVLVAANTHHFIDKNRRKSTQSLQFGFLNRWVIFWEELRWDFRFQRFFMGRWYMSSTELCCCKNYGSMKLRPKF